MLSSAGIDMSPNISLTGCRQLAEACAAEMICVSTNMSILRSTPNAASVMLPPNARIYGHLHDHAVRPDFEVIHLNWRAENVGRPDARRL